MIIKQALPGEENDVAALALKMWPEHEADELRRLFAALLKAPDAAVFVAWEDGVAVGFAQTQLRRDYVEGTSESPVGYLEGIYVEEKFRGRGIARSYWQNVKTGAETGDVRNLRATADWITLTV